MNKMTEIEAADTLEKAPYIDPKEARANVLKVVQQIKADPERFAELKKQLQGKSDEERAEGLVQFIANNDDLVQSLPMNDRETAMTITVTVTVTILIFASSAY
ncbi:hypothetical protein [Novosphingopyxis sp.]|uniref:hypothetical protein n=1 Tax=Novosphingopyxis sp. TaxID=2709690 RepID=UPI003B5CC275